MVLCDLDLPDAPVPATLGAWAVESVGHGPRAIAFGMLGLTDLIPHERDLLSRLKPELEQWLASEDGAKLTPEVASEIRRFEKAFKYVAWKWDSQTHEQSWATLRERLLLSKIAREMGDPEAIVGSVRRLRQQLDRSIRRALIVLTWLPSLLLPLAAIGIGNLMMVSVQIRARQIAILRAVGAVKSQIIRLVLAEALALGLLGSVAGLALGLHEAYSENRVTAALIGFYPEFIIPVTTLIIGVGVTVLTCLLAGIIPARYAARSNIIAAMQTA